MAHSPRGCDSSAARGWTKTADNYSIPAKTRNTSMSRANFLTQPRSLREKLLILLVLQHLDRQHELQLPALGVELGGAAVLRYSAVWR